MCVARNSETFRRVHQRQRFLQWVPLQSVGIADLNKMLVLNHPVQVEIDTGDEPQEIQHMRAEDTDGVVIFLEMPHIDRSVTAAVGPR